jgi:hypothetical protein
MINRPHYLQTILLPKRKLRPRRLQGDWGFCICDRFRFVDSRGLCLICKKPIELKGEYLR